MPYNSTNADKQDGLGKHYRGPVYAGFALVIGTFIASVVTILGACRPLHKYWQINPNPGGMQILFGV